MYYLRTRSVIRKGKEIMFCKWCGGNLASSDTKCKRCGKEVPVLSDCGGFYDLVPNANKSGEVHTGPVAPPEGSVNPPRKTELPREVSSTRSKKAGKKSLLGLSVITVVGFAIVVLLLVIILGKVNQYSNEVNGLRNDLQAINEKIDALQIATKPVETEPEITDPTVVVDPVLAEQDVVFTVAIPGEDSTQKIEADLNLGDYTDTAVITYGFDEMTGIVNSAGYSLKEADTTISLTIDYSSEFRTQSVSVSYVIDDSIYGMSKAPESCKWQYRFDAESDWEDLPEDAFTQTDNARKTHLSIREATLQELIEDSDGQLELRCEIFRANTDNGSLTIVVEGIRFYKEANNKEQTVG